MKILKFRKNNLLSILIFIFLLTNNITTISRRLLKKKANKLQAPSVSTNKNNDIEYFNKVEKFLKDKKFNCLKSSTCKSKIKSLIKYDKLNSEFEFLLENLKINVDVNEYNELDIKEAKNLFINLREYLSINPNEITEYIEILKYFKDLINIAFIYPKFTEYLVNNFNNKTDNKQNQSIFKGKAFFIVNFLRLINLKFKQHQKSNNNFEKVYSIVNINNDCKFVAELINQSKNKYLLISAPIELSSYEIYNIYKNISSFNIYKFMLMKISSFDLCESIDINNAKSTIIKPFTLFEITNIINKNKIIEIEVKCLKNDVNNIDKYKNNIIVSSIN